MSIFSYLYASNSWVVIPIDAFCYFILRKGGQFCERQYMKELIK